MMVGVCRVTLRLPKCVAQGKRQVVKSDGADS